MSLSQFDERTALVTPVQIALADGVALKTLATGALSGQRVDDILASNNDTIPHVLELALTVGAVTYALGSVSVPAGTGWAGAPALSLGATLLPPLQAGWLLGYNNLLKVRVTVAMVGAFVCDVVGFGGAL